MRGYLTELNPRYALVAMPLVAGAPTGIVHLEAGKALSGLHHMQSVSVHVKAIKDDKVYLEPLERNDQWHPHFEAERALYADTDTADREFFEAVRVGCFVETTVTMVKRYGVVASVGTVSVTGTGFIMNQNLLGGREYSEGQRLRAQVLDVDYGKKVVDLREVSEATKGGADGLGSTSGTILLVKDHYTIVKLRNSQQIGFVWHP